MGKLIELGKLEVAERQLSLLFVYSLKRKTQ
jgi:hypothetical protein